MGPPRSRQPRTTAPRQGREEAASPARPRWTEDRVRRELDAFLSEYAEWPTYREFQRHGHKQLRDTVTRLGGARRWASELGIRYVDRPPGYPPAWTEQRVREELRSFLAERKAWPSRIEFERVGRKPLRDAISRTGGPERWAAEFELPRPDLRSGSRRVWTEERIEARLREFLGARTVWPGRREFLDAGLGSLLSALHRRGGAEYWARRLGVARPQGAGPPARRRWTEEVILRELRSFCVDRERWPRYAEFERAGQGHLYRAASLYGGIPYWARRLGY